MTINYKDDDAATVVPSQDASGESGAPSAFGFETAASTETEEPTYENDAFGKESKKYHEENTGDGEDDDEYNMMKDNRFKYGARAEEEDDEYANDVDDEYPDPVTMHSPFQNENPNSNSYGTTVGGSKAYAAAATRQSSTPVTALLVLMTVTSLFFCVMVRGQRNNNSKKQLSYGKRRGDGERDLGV